MATEPLEAPVSTPARPTGRWLFPLGWALLLGGLIVYNVQLFALKQFVVPWYVPILATAGVVVMLVALRRRWTVLRIVGLVMAVLVTGLEWSFLLALSRMPAYAGPEIGQKVPTFAAVRADGSPFTDSDLQGKRTVLVFFRGHW
jgi:hypothetical protein